MKMPVYSTEEVGRGGGVERLCVAFVVVGCYGLYRQQLCCRRRVLAIPVCTKGGGGGVGRHLPGEGMDGVVSGRTRVAVYHGHTQAPDWFFGGSILWLCCFCENKKMRSCARPYRFFLFNLVRSARGATGTRYFITGACGV